MKPNEYIVKAGEHQKTLQDFLCARMGLSRNMAKALIDSRNVFVNRRRIWMARHRLDRDDVVEAGAAVATSEAKAPEDIRILYQDDLLMVVDKPGGLLANGAGSVEALLRKSLGRDDLLASHRLDRDTSGCLIIAKGQDAFAAIVDVFRRHQVRKTYDAIVAGRVGRDTQTLNSPMDGKTASTHVRLLSADRHASHVKVVIETGRTHQIRRHLLSIGHPVLGDKQYGTRFEVEARSVEVPRQMLHASEVEFQHPTKDVRVKAHAPLPGDFRKCLSLYKLR